MSVRQNLEIEGYQLPIVIDRVDECYQATSPALDGLLVLADTIDEVLMLVPGVARALLEAMREKGVTPPIPIEKVHLPAHVNVLVPA